jgi:hypothetical protein
VALSAAEEGESMKKIFFILALAILGTAAFMAKSDFWIVPDINRWQATITGDNKYFPALTVFILALPPLLLLAGIKKLSDRAKKKTP